MEHGRGGDPGPGRGLSLSSQLVRAGIFAKIRDSDSGTPANFKPMFSMPARLVITQDLTEEGQGQAQVQSYRPHSPCTRAHGWCWVSLHSRF